MLAAVQWLPVFVVDLAWLAARPPASQGDMRGLNTAISVVVPMLVIHAVRSRLEVLEDPGVGAEVGALPQARESG